MSSTAVSTIAKPQLRNLLQGYIKKHIIIAGVLAGATGYVWKIMINDKRKAAYANFYKNYDPEAEYQKMKALGVFQSSSV